MSREEVAKILIILKTAYPNFYKNMKKEEVEQTVNLYQEMFSDCDVRLVAVAVKELINTFEYPPTIANIKNKLYELVNISNDKSATELWGCLLVAIRNGYYGCFEEYKKLPDEVKEFVREPRQLRELSEMDSRTINSVVKGQFFKQIEIIKNRIKINSMTLKETKQMISNDDFNTNKLLENND